MGLRPLCSIVGVTLAMMAAASAASVESRQTNAASLEELVRHRRMTSDLEAGFEGRFVRIDDGSAGSVTAVFGCYGPQKTKGIGLH